MAEREAGKFAPGHPGGPGRPKGSINKNTLELRARIQAFMLERYGKEDYCPVLANLERVYRPDSELTEQAKIDTCFKVADFIYPKPKAVELSTPEPLDVKLGIVDQLLALLTKNLE